MKTMCGKTLKERMLKESYIFPYLRSFFQSNKNSDVGLLLVSHHNAGIKLNSFYLTNKICCYKFRCQRWHDMSTVKKASVSFHSTLLFSQSQKLSSDSMKTAQRGKKKFHKVNNFKLFSVIEITLRL